MQQINGQSRGVLVCTNKERRIQVYEFMSGICLTSKVQLVTMILLVVEDLLPPPTAPAAMLASVQLDVRHVLCLKLTSEK